MTRPPKDQPNRDGAGTMGVERNSETARHATARRSLAPPTDDADGGTAMKPIHRPASETPPADNDRVDAAVRAVEQRSTVDPDGTVTFENMAARDICAMAAPVLVAELHRLRAEVRYEREFGMRVYRDVSKALDEVLSTREGDSGGGLAADVWLVVHILQAAERTLAAIRERHRPVDRGRIVACCAGCEDEYSGHDECCHEYPCPTVRILDDTGDGACGGAE